MKVLPAKVCASVPQDVEHIKELQRRLSDVGVTIKCTGEIDAATVHAIKDFQRRYRSRKGFPLQIDGEFNEETVDALCNGRKRAVLSVTNFLLSLITLLFVYKWNNQYWLDGADGPWGTVINGGVLVFLGALLGIKQISLMLPAIAGERLGSLLHRFQTSIGGLLFTAVLCAISFSIMSFTPTQKDQLIGPITKTILHVGIVKNGGHPYKDIADGFRETLDKILETSSWTANYEEVTGYGQKKDLNKNAEVFEKLLNSFTTSPDYLVTIGTQVSEYAAKIYRDKIPIIFVGVTDPIRSDIVKHYGADTKRGNIAGVTYGIPLLDRLAFMSNAFPGRKFAYVYNKSFPQDLYMKEAVLEMQRIVRPPIRIIPIESSTPQLSAEQSGEADVFFGWQYVSANIRDFVASTPKPFVGVTVQDIKKGAVATIGSDDKRLGGLAAQKILFRNLFRHEALSKIPIIQPDTSVTGINLRKARKLGVSISEDARKRAQIIIP